MNLMQEASKATMRSSEQEQGLVVKKLASMSPFGKAIAKEFMIDPTFRNLNHGSFGTIPRAIQAKQRAYQALAEARPDPFIRYSYPDLLDTNRAAVAALLRVPTDTVILISNATVGINVVLRNLTWNPDGRDEILYFDTIYAGCGKTIDYIVATRGGRVSSKCIPLPYPLEDAEVLARFEAAVADSTAAGKRPRVCLMDVVSSLPAVRFPFEALTATCRARSILSLVDGAQGVGLVDLDLGAAGPDFFVSNCHKWLHVPRACAVLHVPLRNQALLPSSLPTSHGYEAPTGVKRFNPLPPSHRSVFVTNFQFVGTLDNAPYLCVEDAIRWRAEVLGGEERVLAYTHGLARAGGRLVARALGTEVLENQTGTLGVCAMTNVALPLWVGTGPEGAIVLAEAEAMEVKQWMLETIIKDYSTFIALYTYRGQFWCRLSAQVYLDMDDFEFAARVLKEMCRRAATKVLPKANL